LQLFIREVPQVFEGLQEHGVLVMWHQMQVRMWQAAAKAHKPYGTCSHDLLEARSKSLGKLKQRHVLNLVQLMDFGDVATGDDHAVSWAE